MTRTRRTRVAAVQYHVGPDIAENLETTLRMIDQAAEGGPDLVVLPEFVNHCSWYDESDPQHCYKVSVDLDGEFLSRISSKAAEHSIHLVVNVSLRREDGVCSGTSILYGPGGEMLGTADKQVLIGHENFHLRRAETISPVIKTPIGRIGLYACMDGVVNETPRSLALRGAQILCNSLNSFAFDEASLHIPVRAAENKVFVVAANKVGPLIPEELVEPVGQMISIPGHFLSGAGESQIVAPDGTVLAKAPTVGESVVCADIDIWIADHKQREDGTDIFASRRTDLYAPIASEPVEQELAPGAEKVKVAVFQPAGSGIDTLVETREAVREAAEQGVQLLVLPELFILSEPKVEDLAIAVEDNEMAIAELCTLARETGVYIAASVIEANEAGCFHQGMLFGPEGICLRQPQLHPSARHAEWMVPGDGVSVVQLPFARVAIVTGDDAIYPETFRLAVLKGAELVVAPIDLQESWELELGLPERAAENRVCVVAASRPRAVGASMFLTLWDDFTLMTPWKKRLFDGNISAPLGTLAPRFPGLFTDTVHPSRTANKVLSPMTHVVDSRPWKLADALVAK